MKTKREIIERVTVTARFEEREAMMSAFAVSEWRLVRSGPKLLKSLRVSETHLEYVFERINS